MRRLSVKTKLIELTEKLKGVTKGIQDYVRYGERNMREVKYVLINDYGTPRPFTSLEDLQRWVYNNLSRNDIKSYEVFEITALERYMWVEDAQQKDNTSSVR